MAYSGFLLRIGSYTVPAKKFIQAESYVVQHIIQDADTYTDGNGVLHRDALEHRPLKIEFNTPAMLTDAEMSELFDNISENFTVPSERKAYVTAWSPEDRAYITQEMYMPDPVFTIHSIMDGVIRYKPLRIALIGY